MSFHGEHINFMSHNKKARTKEGGVADTCGLIKKKRNTYTVLVGTVKERDWLRNLKRRWVDNIKMGVNDILYVWVCLDSS